MASNWNADWSSGTLALEFLTRMFSPYQMNPLAINPLRQLIERIVDFERVRASPLKLFVSATNLRTGRPRVFKTAEMSADAVLASACLPSLNQPVEIAGEHYWDGGFTANPAILPLVAECETHDIMIVRITPASETELPVTARDIHGRLNRIVFNAPLHREMQTIAWMQDMVGASGADCGPLGQKLSRLRLHHIDGDEVMRPLGAASAMHADWSLISHLHDHGRMRSGDWLENNWRAIAVQPVAAE